MTQAIVMIALVMIAFYFLSVYKTLTRLVNNYIHTFSQIELALKRRHDLIFNLVQTTKKYLNHESKTLESLIQARNSAKKHLKRVKEDVTNSTLMTGLNQAENGLSLALGGLNLMMEDYPDLKDEELIKELHEALKTVESSMTSIQKIHNDSVKIYNNYRKFFPYLVVATVTGRSRELMTLDFLDSRRVL